MTHGRAYLWMQEGEPNALAECGCTMVRDRDGSPCFWFCPLHAASPDLLAAAEEAERQFGEVVDTNLRPLPDGFQAAWHVVRAAIRKARGE